MLRGLVALLFLGLGTWSAAQTMGESKKSIEQGSLENRVNTLASIQPGLGTVMHEMAYRFTNTYWAANGGNWGLAQYQLKELLEAQEIGEITRPQHAPMLKANEQTYLAPLAKAIEKQDIQQFNHRFSEAVNGCNACHTALGYGFIQFKPSKLPKQEFLDFSIKPPPSTDHFRSAGMTNTSLCQPVAVSDVAERARRAEPAWPCCCHATGQRAK